MRYFIATFLMLALAGGTHPPDKADTELATFVVELKRDILIRAGMTVEQVRSFVAENNQKIHDREPKWTGKFEPPIFSRPELHLYVFIDMNSTTPPPDGRSLTYFANGRHQFWMDMTIHDGKVKNIYVAPGNLSCILLPAFLYDGSGEHVGMLAGQKQ